MHIQAKYGTIKLKNICLTKEVKPLATIAFAVKLKKPTRVKHKQWVEDQLEYTKCLNWFIQEVYRGEKLSSKDAP